MTPGTCGGSTRPSGRTSPAGSPRHRELSGGAPGRAWRAVRDRLGAAGAAARERQGGFPVIANLTGLPRPLGVPALKAGTTTVYPDQNWPNPKAQQEHLTAVQELFSGEIDVSAVLSRMDHALKEKD